MHDKIFIIKEHAEEYKLLQKDTKESLI